MTGHRVLIAPVTVTPAKPLTPSHLKGLLWTDVMYRASAQLADVTYRYSPTTYHPCEQTSGFWAYLDRTFGDRDYADCSESDIGELYVAYRKDGAAAPGEHQAYLEAIEAGWVHPAGARVLDLWTEHYARLGMHDPGLVAHQPPGLGLDEVLDRLAAAGLCLDQRADGGPVYLDATRHGMPLRKIVSADGRPNYLACALRELVPLAASHDEIVLLYDSELEPDYVLLARVLAELGPEVHRVSLGRVPIDGRILSARHGGWQGHTAGELLDAVSGEHDKAALRLGMRLYFIAVLGPGARESFREDLLRRAIKRAERLLSLGVDGPPAPDVLARHRPNGQHVDPYRLTASLLARHGEAPSGAVLAEVFT